MGKKLNGAKEIRDYLGCTESTLMEHISLRAFPAKLGKAGVYEADVAEVDKWLGVKEAAEKAEAEDRAEAETKKPAKKASKKKTE